MRSLTLAQAAQLLKCAPPLSSVLIQGYSVDTRSLKKGHLFFAIPGERVDGHAFLRQAKEKGAAAAVVSNQYEGESFGLPLMRVENPLYSLQELARLLLARSSPRVVAITGSLGKTTTKVFTQALLATRYRVAASPGNSNSQIGLPLAILNHSDGDEELLVLEMGMTLPGQIARLVEIAPPEVAVVTTVALVHACNFDSINDIARAKGEILCHPHTRLGVVSRTIPGYEEMIGLGSCNKISFSTSSTGADYSLNPLPPHHLQTTLEKLEIDIPPLPFPGRHNTHNLLAAIAVARYFHIEWDEIKGAIASMQLPDRRCQLVEHKGVLFLNDSYNAAESSVIAALESMPLPKEGGRKIAVLGGMVELGRFSHECHERVGEFALGYVEQVYCLGDECRPIYDIWRKAGRPVHLFENRAELVCSLKANLYPSDVVLLKGSCSKELWKVLEEI